MTPPKHPIVERETSKKRKVSPTKRSSQKKSKASKPKLRTMLTMYDINLIIIVVSDTSEDILHHKEEKQETMYDRIEEELKGAQKSLYCSPVVSTTPLSSEGIEVGNEIT